MLKGIGIDKQIIIYSVQYTGNDQYTYLITISQLENSKVVSDPESVELVEYDDSGSSSTLNSDDDNPIPERYLSKEDMPHDFCETLRVSKSLVFKKLVN